eukprot:COSAG06_NODE_9089_length_1989_cov_36.719577_3_plen_68_part_00
MILSACDLRLAKIDSEETGHTGSAPGAREAGLSGGRGAAGAQVVNEVVDWLVLLRCSAYGAGGAAAS